MLIKGFGPDFEVGLLREHPSCLRMSVALLRAHVGPRGGVGGGGVEPITVAKWLCLFFSPCLASTQVGCVLQPPLSSYILFFFAFSLVLPWSYSMTHTARRQPDSINQHRAVSHCPPFCLGIYWPVSIGSEYVLCVGESNRTVSIWLIVCFCFASLSLMIIAKFPGFIGAKVDWVCASEMLISCISISVNIQTTTVCNLFFPLGIIQ